MRVHDVERHEGDDAPDDRLHRVAAAMLDAAAFHPEGAGLHVIAFVTEERDGHSNATTAIGGYEGDDKDAQAATDILLHMTAVFEANGMKMTLVPFDGPMGGRG